MEDTAPGEVAVLDFGRLGLTKTRTPADAARCGRWCRDVAGRRVHGTTRRQPLVVFLDEERETRALWDGEPYEITHWRTVKVHPDHHVALPVRPVLGAGVPVPSGTAGGDRAGQ